ncbi:copper chaperone PCu(A)C [Streptomyces yaizuensis]|uniref:Copper chaperone PCu(A)C n=1 Tax=Streptomyces yaizuensis TaxID=2989713 RepID=A0ABQ5NZI8_9ACTN|nr:copper chaperone PCu(A)C [Streptomyces sp. YSPA8]GLF95774.1 copper chaperone PCu(A)C [Streptomyces sp. YSPA8]
MTPPIIRARTRTRALAGVALCAALTLTGCSAAADDGPDKGSGGDRSGLSVDGAFMPRPVSDMAAGFLTVRNAGDTADKLTGVTSPLSDDVTIHESKDQRMRQVKAFDIPARGELALERGGSHIMFMGLDQRPEEGDTVTVRLSFEKAAPLTVELPVKDTSYRPPAH